VYEVNQIILRYCGNSTGIVNPGVSSFIMIFQSDETRQSSGFSLNWKPKQKRNSTSSAQSGLEGSPVSSSEEQDSQVPQIAIKIKPSFFPIKKHLNTEFIIFKIINFPGISKLD
jgi:hypothetical protein